MKTVSILLLLVWSLSSAPAASTINTVNKYAYGANIGWTDWRADGANGVTIGEFVCSGYLYAANIGWINLGSGTPVNGIQYRNNSASDFGVNHDGAGKLRGYAYAANIGWVNFENAGAPRIDLKTGTLSGYVYGANVGWISLSNAVAHVQTDTIAPGPMDTGGLSVAWELLHFGHTGVNPDDDPDSDGMSNLQEYLADTNPLDANDTLRITAYSMYFSGPSIDVHNLTWTSRPTRLYRFQFRNGFDAGSPWQTSTVLISPDPGPTTSNRVAFGESSQHAQRFLRVEAVRPLAP